MTSNFVAAVERAYWLGVATTTAILWIWLLAGTTVLRRRDPKNARATTHLLACLYVFLGYILYGFLLGPITGRFLRSVAHIEMIDHPWWVTVAIPAGSILIWLALLVGARPEA